MKTLEKIVAITALLMLLSSLGACSSGGYYSDDDSGGMSASQAIAIGMMGMGQSFQNQPRYQQPAPINCTTYTLGTQTYTSCN